MQIKSVRSALITNYEVLRLLEESQEAQKQVQKRDPSVEYPEHLRTVQFEVNHKRCLQMKSCYVDTVLLLAH